MVEAPFTYFLNLYLRRRSSAKEEADHNGNVFKVNAQDESDRQKSSDAMEQRQEASNWVTSEREESKLKKDFGHFQDIELEENVNQNVKNEENSSNNTAVNREENDEVFRF